MISGIRSPPDLMPRFFHTHHGLSAPLQPATFPGHYAGTIHRCALLSSRSLLKAILHVPRFACVCCRNYCSCVGLGSVRSVVDLFGVHAEIASGREHRCFCSFGYRQPDDRDRQLVGYHFSRFSSQLATPPVAISFTNSNPARSRKTAGSHRTSDIQVNLRPALRWVLFPN